MGWITRVVSALWSAVTSSDKRIELSLSGLIHLNERQGVEIARLDSVVSHMRQELDQYRHDLQACRDECAECHRERNADRARLADALLKMKNDQLSSQEIEALRFSPSTSNSDAGNDSSDDA